MALLVATNQLTYTTQNKILGKGETFQDFHARFESLAIQVKLPDDMMINELKEKLNGRYFKAVNLLRFKDIDELVDHCLNLQYDFQRHDAKFPNEGRNKPGRSGGSNTSGSSGQKSSSQPGSSQQKPRNKIPFPEQYRKLPKMTAELRAQLDAEGKCRACREPGHMSFEEACPINKWRKANELANSSSLSLAQISAFLQNQGQSSKAPEMLALPAPGSGNDQA